MSALTRRDLLVGGTAALALGGGLIAARASPAGFLFERRLPGAAAMDLVVRRAGHAVRLSGDDVGTLAMQLQAEWARRPSILIGYSMAGTAFVIEQIARRSGLRFVQGDVAPHLPAGRATPALFAGLLQRARTPPAAASWWLVAPAGGL